jgi:hypothetical protein
LHWRDSHPLDYQLASLHLPANLFDYEALTLKAFV